MTREESIKALAKREINTLRIGRVELQNNHGTLYCFYEGRCVFKWENKADDGFKRIKKVDDWNWEKYNRKEKTRVTNVFLKLVGEHRKYIEA